MSHRTELMRSCAAFLPSPTGVSSLMNRVRQASKSEELQRPIGE